MTTEEKLDILIEAILLKQYQTTLLLQGCMREKQKIKKDGSCDTGFVNLNFKEYAKKGKHY